MARERYLVGVSKEELEYTPPPPPPKTVRGKLENFWYHYKWGALGALFAVVIGTILIVQMVTKTRPDYILCVAAQQELSRNTVERLEQEFEAVGRDINGDGKVEVTIQSINVSTQSLSGGLNTGHQAMMGHLVARDVIFFAVDPTYYRDSISQAMKDDALFFDSLSVTADGVSDDGTYWNWKDIALLSEDDFKAYELGAAAPKELYFGVRTLPQNASEKAIEEQQIYLELLRAFIAAQA